jgi:hypothetical protein
VCHQTREEKIMLADVGRARALRARAPGTTRVLASAAVLLLLVALSPRDARADVFGQCAHQRDIASKIAACIEASKSTSFRKALHWIFRELARAHYDRGETELAILSYARSLAAEDREAVWREMQALLDLM